MNYRVFCSITSLLIGSLLLSGLVGCEQQAPQQAAGRVAVIDMAHLAKISGYEQRINQAMHQTQQEQQAKLMALQVRLGLDKPPAQPTNAQEGAKLAAAQHQLQEALQEAQSIIQAKQFNELEQFRNVVRPIAERVAAAKGCSIVMELRDGMLSIDPTSNITDEVAAEMPQTQSPSAQSPIAPANPFGQNPAGQGLPPQTNKLPGLGPVLTPPQTPSSQP